MLYTTDDLLDGCNINSHNGDFESLTKAVQPRFIGLKITGWEPVKEGDCWIKSYKEPELDDEGYTVIDGIKCSVRAPGGHPGLKSWWCDPIETVWAPVVEEELDEPE